MSEKTDATRSKKWIPWAIVILLVAATAGSHFYFTTQTMIDKSVWVSNGVIQAVVPSGHIQHYAAMESIQQFNGSGMEPAAFWRATGMSALGLLIVLILAPWLLVKGYVLMERSGNRDKLIPVWYAGAAVMVVAISSYAFIIGNIVIQNYVNTTNKIMIEASQSKDELRSVMMDLAFDVSERMILAQANPDPDNGEAGAPGAAAISLEQLASYGQWEKFEISIAEQQGDSLLTLTGTLRDRELAEASDSRPITMRITPHNDDLFDFVNTP